jgi:hypothetical protein
VATFLVNRETKQQATSSNETGYTKSSTHIVLTYAHLSDQITPLEVMIASELK